MNLLSDTAAWLAEPGERVSSPRIFEEILTPRESAGSSPKNWHAARFRNMIFPSGSRMISPSCNASNTFSRKPFS
jgi:hypothetical protein